MIAKATIIAFFSKSKVMFATIAAVVTFSITVYNQFKTTKATEISGIVSVNKEFAKPVDAIVRISSPIQAQTETDSKGRFKFKLENLQSDTFLLIVQNKKTNTVAKQNEYVNASRGRTDIVVVFNSDMKDGGIFTSFDKGDTVHQNKSVLE
jgi:predicted lipase